MAMNRATNCMVWRMGKKPKRQQLKAKLEGNEEALGGGRRVRDELHSWREKNRCFQFL